MRFFLSEVLRSLYSQSAENVMNTFVLKFICVVFIAPLLFCSWRLLFCSSQLSPYFSLSFTEIGTSQGANLLDQVCEFSVFVSCFQPMFFILLKKKINDLSPSMQSQHCGYIGTFHIICVLQSRSGHLLVMFAKNSFPLPLKWRPRLTLGRLPLP